MPTIELTDSAEVHVVIEHAAEGFKVEAKANGVTLTFALARECAQRLADMLNEALAQ